MHSTATHTLLADYYVAELAPSGDTVPLELLYKGRSLLSSATSEDQDDCSDHSNPNPTLPGMQLPNLPCCLLWPSRKRECMECLCVAVL